MKGTLRKKCCVLDGSRALQELEIDPALVNDASENVEGEPGLLTGMELEPVYPNKTLVSVSASRRKDKEKSHEPELLSSPCNNHGSFQQNAEFPVQEVCSKPRICKSYKPNKRSRLPAVKVLDTNKMMKRRNKRDTCSQSRQVNIEYILDFGGITLDLHYLSLNPSQAQPVLRSSFTADMGSQLQQLHVGPDRQDLSVYFHLVLEKT
ncbi:hypothetical protein HGM15179_019023 [Zosterops borbonicus]|uniref:Uncharacterized protein n=1 Tax=Zosterops borbonicus TaxID=364589 RepID=A0A8K1DAN5_9PASS|nr:hypothetical protein HGM15179_019023 [Zosterops borbonicus]